MCQIAGWPSFWHWYKSQSSWVKYLSFKVILKLQILAEVCDALKNLRCDVIVCLSLKAVQGSNPRYKTSSPRLESDLNLNYSRLSRMLKCLEMH